MSDRRTYRKYTDQQIIDCVPQVESMAGLLRLLGLRPVGGNYLTMKQNLQRLNLSCDHWTGQAWNKGNQNKDWSQLKKLESFKRRLIQERGAVCESCSLSKWMSVPIAIEMHHIDGDRTNNKKTNLQLLCPNCHSLTDNFRGKNIKSD